MSLITLKEVSYSYQSKYNRVQALKQVNATFERGTFYAIIGKSGSGKSTLLSLLAGLDLPHEGKIYFNEVSMADINKEKHRRENVAVIYQHFNLFPLLTSNENIMYAMELNGIKQEEARVKAEQLMEKVKLEKHCKSHYPSMLSGGEQQRVAIARALGTKAFCLLADEPTGNIDTETGTEILQIFRQLAHKDNYCVIIVTHDLEAANSADKVYEMSDGKLNERKVFPI